MTKVPEAAFRAAIADAGLRPPEEIIADGKLHRFPTSDRGRDDSGWFVLHADGVPAGAFGDWRTGLSRTWRAKEGARLSPIEEAAHRARIEQARRERAEEAEARQERARETAQRIWARCELADPGHVYLVRKRIGPHGAKIDGGSLVIALRDASQTLRNVQFIRPEGRKVFLPGGRVSGLYWSEGTAPRDGEPLLIGEGFATMASAREATGFPVVAALSAGNLEAVAVTLRTKYPDAAIVVCADNDAIGQDKANRAAKAARARLALPRLPGDFNDLACREGLGAVRAIIEATL